MILKKKNTVDFEQKKYNENVVFQLEVGYRSRIGIIRNMLCSFIPMSIYKKWHMASKSLNNFVVCVNTHNDNNNNNRKREHTTTE